jgi:trimeric autotransporter adhesin
VCCVASCLLAYLYRSRNDSSFDSPSECNTAALSDNSTSESSAAARSTKSSSSSGRNRKSSTNEPLKQQSSSRSSTSNAGAPLRLTDSYWNNKFEAVFMRKTEGGSLRNSELGAIAVTEDGEWDSDMERVGDADEYAYSQEEIDYYRGRRASNDTIDSSDDEHRIKGGVGLCGSPLEPLGDDGSSCDWSSSNDNGSKVTGQKVEVSTANWQLGDDNAAADSTSAITTTKQNGHQQKQQHANTTATTATASVAKHTHNDSAQMTADELMKQMRIAFLCDSATPSVSDGLVASSRRSSTSTSTAHIAVTKLKQQQQQQHSRRRSSSASSSSTQAPADTTKGGTVWRHDALLHALQSDASIDVSIDSSVNDDTDICSNRSGSSHSDSQQSITSTATVAAGNGIRSTTTGNTGAAESRSADAIKLHTADTAKHVQQQQQQQQQQQPHSIATAASTLAAAADSAQCAQQQTAQLIQPLDSKLLKQKHSVNAAAAGVQTNTAVAIIANPAQLAENSRRTSNAAADAICSSSAVKPSAIRGGGKLWQYATDALQLSASQHMATDRTINSSSSRRSSLQHQQQQLVTTAAAAAAVAHPKSYPCSPTKMSSTSNNSSTSATATTVTTAVVCGNSLSTPTSPTGYISKHPTIELPYNELKGIGKPASSLGIDPYKREQHLSDAEFYAVFQCDRRAFYALPKWRQLSKKKAALLF